MERMQDKLKCITEMVTQWQLRIELSILLAYVAIHQVQVLDLSLTSTPHDVIIALGWITTARLLPADGEHLVLWSLNFVSHVNN